MKKLLALGAAALLALNISAQKSQSVDDWYFGITAGTRASYTTYTKIDKNLYPTRDLSLGSGLFSVYVQHYFGESRAISIRPEIAFLNRGGGISHIHETVLNYYQSGELENIYYRNKFRYIDVRMPIAYNFGAPDNIFRPYVYVAPVLGFRTGGNMKLTYDYYYPATHTYASTSSKMKVNSDNTSRTLFAADFGVGLNMNLSVMGQPCTLGVEYALELGLTNTFGKDRTYDACNLIPDGSPMVDNAIRPIKIDGSRRMWGNELKVTIGVPFSVFSCKEAETYIYEEPAPIYPEESDEPEEVVTYLVDYDCYSLDEIIAMMARGESVEGKTICAIDDAINFEFGKSDINPDSFEYLDKLAKTLIRTRAHVKVKGHTDNIGAEDFNMNLSRERALSVLNYLVEQGVPRANLSYEYFGMSMPMTSNDTPEGRRLNRRVEFEILN